MKPKRILIIDDEFPMRYLIEHQLRRQGYEVSLAKDGPGGLKAAQLYHPDLIVLDIMMPGMDGFEVCQEIRNDAEINLIPIIFLTGCEAKEYKMRAFDVGADDYLTKPFQADELTAHVTAVLRRSDRIQTGNLKAAPQQVVALYSPKGGVGTTTLAIQLGEAMTMREDRPVALIDLDLPFGGIAATLNLYTKQHIVNVLAITPERLSLPLLKQFVQYHRADLLVIPAPGNLLDLEEKVQPAHLKAVLDTLSSNGYQVILDLGSTLTDLTETALHLSDVIFVITSGQPVANKLHDTFLATADRLGLESHRLMPVINELHGPVGNVKLARTPIARITHASERSRTRLWLKEQGIHKLVSVTRCKPEY
jgi:CheY-like chemotaxis protein